MCVVVTDMRIRTVYTEIQVIKRVQILFLETVNLHTRRVKRTVYCAAEQTALLCAGFVGKHYKRAMMHTFGVKFALFFNEQKND